MANYVRYGTPWVNSVAPPALTAAFLTALENTLIQPSGGSETGKWFVAGSVHSNGDVIDGYFQTISRTTIPVSVSFDTLDTAPTGGVSGFATGNLSHGGFQIYSLSTTATNANARGGGNWTVNY